MGLYLSVYAGPYLLCERKSEQGRHPDIRYCSKCNRGSSKGLKDSGPFCTQCGGEIATKPGKPKGILLPSYHQYDEALDQDGLGEGVFFNCSEFGPVGNFDGEHHMLLVNSMIQGGPRESFHIEEDKGVWLKHNDFDVQAEIVWFKQAYARHIEVLEELYRKVEVEWAFIHYSS